MRTLLRSFGTILLIGGTATALGYFLLHRPLYRKHPGMPAKTVAGIPGAERPGKELEEKLHTVSARLQAFSKTKGYNSRVAFLVDMSIPSGRNRFFVYNMQKDSIETTGLVTHGYGSDKSGVEFSNVPGSYCTSLGRYKVGGSYNGRFGLAFKLYGLDKTNDKAFERFVVLHSHSCVPGSEVFPEQICESQGCPTVAPAFLQELKTYIEAAGKPILLYIYQ
ncbi:MAG: murein L,D-transpeptidase catalytic domain family protein [Ferruginibacter sp.]